MRAHARHIRRFLAAAVALFGIVFAMGASSITRAGADVTGERWNGFSQSTVNAPTRDLATLLVDRRFRGGLTGRLQLSGRTFYVQATFTADGAFSGAGGGITLRGTLAPIGESNYALSLTYDVIGPNDRGTLVLLRMYPPDPDNPIGFPPDPCRGSYVNSEGSPGSLLLEQKPRGELDPPSDFKGRITFGAQSFYCVGTVAQNRNTDGSFSFQIVGMNSQAGQSPQRVRITGRYVPGAIQPCIRVAGTLRGDYTMLDLAGKSLDAGTFEMTF